MKPLVWYHGGPELTYLDAMQWDRKRGERDQNAAGPGMYFTLDRREASGYGEFLYSATTKPGFRFMPVGPTTVAFIRAMYDYAPAEYRQSWFEDLGVATIAQAARFYTSNTMLDAAILLYHDLFRYNADAYTTAIRQIYDGVRVRDSGTGNHGKSVADGMHLVTWSVEKLAIKLVRGGKTRKNPAPDGMLEFADFSPRPRYRGARRHLRDLRWIEIDKTIQRRSDNRESAPLWRIWYPPPYSLGGGVRRVFLKETAVSDGRGGWFSRLPIEFSVDIGVPAAPRKLDDDDMRHMGMRGYAMLQRMLERWNELEEQGPPARKRTRR